MRDFDRAIDDRGRGEAAWLAMVMRVNGYEPAVIVCSTARRCAETLDVVLASVPAKAAVIRSETLYTGGHEAYLDMIIAQVDAPSILVVGHNPMIEDTAMALVDQNHSALSEALGGGFPTAGLLIVDVNVDTSAMKIGKGRFVALLSPLDA